MQADQRTCIVSERTALKTNDWSMSTMKWQLVICGSNDNTFVVEVDDPQVSKPFPSSKLIGAGDEYTAGNETNTGIIIWVN